MSETERKKATLKVVTTCEGKPYGKGDWSVQDYISNEYSVYVKEELSDKEGLDLLREFYQEAFDQSSPYFLVGGLLYKKESEEALDPFHNVTASWKSSGVLEVDCTWYNGGAAFEDMIETAIKSLEE
jgi:hypothetical protein